MAKKDISKLTRKVITNKRGQKQVVWVKGGKRLKFKRDSFGGKKGDDYVPSPNIVMRHHKKHIRDLADKAVRLSKVGRLNSNHKLVKELQEENKLFNKNHGHVGGIIQDGKLVGGKTYYVGQVHNLGTGDELHADYGETADYLVVGQRDGMLTYLNLDKHSDLPKTRQEWMHVADISNMLLGG